MPELVGPQPVESREAYDKVVAEYKEAQSNGSNLPEVAYVQPGQVVTPEQLPDPLVNLRAGFAPQDISSVVVLPKDEALAHPSGPELADPARLGKFDDYKIAAKFAAENAESYDEQKRLDGLSAPEREQGNEDQGSASGAAHESASARSSRSSAKS